jgi:hypothetical protein
VNHQKPLPIWTAAAAILLFVVHAVNFLYFFVDDESIPYVYAQNLLHGKGLVYNALEGRVEGYSDFLHVGAATLILAVVRAAHLPKVSVFFIGKAWSFVCAIGIVVLVWTVLRRLRIDKTAAATGLAFLALAPPLAIWSCSSLETVPFALTVTILVAALMFDADRWAAAAAVLLLLERIDGFVYAGALIGAFVVTADAPRRRAMLMGIALPAAAAFTLYHAWRFWYFGDLLPAPLESKILYKLRPHANLVVKAPDESYLHQFINVYGWPAAAAVVLGAVAAFRGGGLPRRLLIAVIPLFAYVSLVGDWMFGFRFFVTLMPALALVIAVALNPLALRRPKAVAVLGIVSTVYLGLMASRFVETFRKTENLETFFRAPSRDLHRFFWPYYSLYEAGRRLMRPGEIVAYNQAGFIPFMLDLNNIDDLGICSRFYAELPTTDVYFTEVGRYAPLTNERDLRAGQAYLLYDNARFVLSRTDILFRANRDMIPATLFGGYYELVGLDAEQQNAIYRRTAKAADEYRTDPHAFDENVAHVSYVKQATIDGVTIDPADYRQRLKFLEELESDVAFTRRVDISIVFAAADELLRAVTIKSVRTSEPSTVKITLWTKDGRIVHEAAFDVDRSGPLEVASRVTDGTRASRLELEISSSGDDRAWLTDVRVQGQTPALEHYIKTRLRFPAPPAPFGP